MLQKLRGLPVTVIPLLLAVILAIPLVTFAATENGITSPENGAKVSGTVDVQGVADDADFSKWQLDILPGGDSNSAIFVAVGEEAVTEPATLASIDTTAFPDGTHALRLRVVRSDSNYDEYISEFTIANAKTSARATVAAAVSSLPDIVDTAVASGQFETLVTAVKSADLVEALKAAGPFTVFAPTQEAFAALPEGTLESLLADPAALANVLTFHVVPGKVMAADLSNGMTATTLQGSSVTFDLSDGAKVNGANIVQTDIEAGNGVIHVIDQVILPPADAPAATPAAAPAAAPSANGITRPADGATTSGSINVRGVASDPDFAKWQLDILPGGDSNSAIFVAVGEEMVTEPSVLATIDSTAFPDGTHAFRLRVVRSDSNYDEYVSEFTIANGAQVVETSEPEASTSESATEEASMEETAEPEPVATEPAAPAAPASANGITAPTDGATISGTADVQGVASDSDFVKWQLDVLPGGDGNAAIFVALGEEAVTEPATLATIDTTMFPDGTHALRLRVVRSDSNYDEYITEFTIANEQ